MNPAKITLAIDLLKKALPEATIVLFGSHARGEAHQDSDLDFLIIKPIVLNRRKEIVQLLRLFEPYEIPVDIFVVTHTFFETWKNVPGTMLYEANREGKIVYEPREILSITPR